jgi:hypothetical protein
MSNGIVFGQYCWILKNALITSLDLFKLEMFYFYENWLRLDHLKFGSEMVGPSKITVNLISCYPVGVLFTNV